MSPSAPTLPTERVPATGSWRRLVQRTSRPYGVFLVLIIATVSWRSGAYFEGDFDAVVVIKALLSLVGLAAAFLTTRSRPARDIPAFPFVFLGLYLLISLIGAASTASPMPSAVIVVRMGILALAIAVLASRTDPTELLGSLVAALATVAGFSVLTGLPSVSQGRLAGGIPPLHPNEIAFVSCMVILWCLSRLTHGRDRIPHLIGFLGGAAVLLATGSRTSWVALPLGLLSVMAHARAIRLRTLWLALAAVPVLTYILIGTTLVQDLIRRDSSEAQLLTLSNRTIAWEAALGPKATGWLEWFGGGLAMKRIEVPGQWWTDQILDSSWVSAVVQGGFLGAAVCVVWLIVALIRAWQHTSGMHRGLLVGILAYLIVRGIAESGLFDASTALMMLITCQLTMPTRPREFSGN